MVEDISVDRDLVRFIIDRQLVWHWYGDTYLLTMVWMNSVSLDSGVFTGSPYHCCSEMIRNNIITTRQRRR